MNTWLIILALVVVATPIVASSFICVPKWWNEVVDPHMPDFEPVDTSGWLWMPWRAFVSIIRFIFLIFIAMPIFLILGAVVKYIVSWTSWIERKCPYTNEADVQRHDSSTNEAIRFTDGWIELIVGIWKLATGQKDLA